MSYQGPGTYRHYKGGEYNVHGLGLREETVTKVCPQCGSDSVAYHPTKGGLFICPYGHTYTEPLHTGETVVVYEPLTPGSILEERGERFWTRPLKVFNEYVRTENDDGSHNRVPRFDRISPVLTITQGMMLRFKATLTAMSCHDYVNTDEKLMVALQAALKCDDK